METTRALSVDELLSLSESKLKEYGYERTIYGVKKLVDKNSQFDIGAEAILNREGIELSPKWLNDNFEIGDGTMTIVAIDKANPSTQDFFSVMQKSLIRINAITSTGEYIRLTFTVSYTLKSWAKVQAFKQKDTSKIASTEIKPFGATLYDPYTPSSIRDSEDDEVFIANGQKFVPGYVRDPRRVVFYRRWTK